MVINDSIQWHVAQMNVAHALHDMDDERMRGFVEQLDAINALADASPGFVWRLQSESGNATDIEVPDDPSMIVNLSVWTDIESLFDFAYRTDHRKVVAGRRAWFRKPEGPYQVLWWVPAGQRPGVADGLERLALLAANGPVPGAFTFRDPFAPPDASVAPVGEDPAPWCSGWD